MYYLTIVQNENVVASYYYTNLDDALVLFHNELAYRSDARTSTLCVILNKEGDVIKKGYYTA